MSAAWSSHHPPPPHTPGAQECGPHGRSVCVCAQVGCRAQSAKVLEGPIRSPAETPTWSQRVKMKLKPALLEAPPWRSL